MDIKEKAYNKIYSKLHSAIHKWQAVKAGDWQWMGIDEAPTVRLNQIKQHKQQVEIYEYIEKLIANDRIRNAATIYTDSRKNI